MPTHWRFLLIFFLGCRQKMCHQDGCALRRPGTPVWKVSSLWMACWDSVARIQVGFICLFQLRRWIERCQILISEWDTQWDVFQHEFLHPSTYSVDLYTVNSGFWFLLFFSFLFSNDSFILARFCSQFIDVEKMELIQCLSPFGLQ